MLNTSWKKVELILSLNNCRFSLSVTDPSLFLLRLWIFSSCIVIYAAVPRRPQSLVFYNAATMVTTYYHGHHGTVCVYQASRAACMVRPSESSSDVSIILAPMRELRPSRRQRHSILTCHCAITRTSPVIMSYGERVCVW